MLADAGKYFRVAKLLVLALVDGGQRVKLRSPVVASNPCRVGQKEYWITLAAQQNGEWNLRNDTEFEELEQCEKNDAAKPSLLPSI